MKNKLLLLVAMLLTSAVSFAQWKMPAPASQPITEGAQYFYNLEYGGFLYGGHDWGTRACVRLDNTETRSDDRDGKRSVQKVTLTKADEDGGVQYYKFGAFSPDGPTGIWIDGSRAGNTSFYFEEIGDGTYHILTSMFAESTGEKYIGWCMDKTFQDTRVNAYAEPVGGTWISVSQAAYDAFVATLPSNREKIEACRWAIQLKVGMDAAKAKYEDINLSEVEAIYNNTSATKDQLKNAVENTLPQIIGKYEASKKDWDKATVAEPLEVSDLLVNPNFAEGAKGWNGGPVINFSVAEAYMKAFDIYQVLYGVHPGVYRAKAQGFYRRGFADAAYSDYKANKYIYDAKLYANSSQGNIKSPFEDMAKVDNTWAGGWSAVDVNGDTQYIPNNMEAAASAFKEGLYKTEALLFADVDSMRIGVKKELGDTPNGNWVIFGNFGLEYLGDGIDAYQLLADPYDKVDVANTFAHKQLMDDYNAAIDAVKTGTEKDAVKAAFMKLTALSDSITKSKEEYQKLLTVWQTAETSYNQMRDGGATTAEFKRLGQYLMETAANCPAGYATAVNDDLKVFVHGCRAYINANKNVETCNVDAEVEYVKAINASAILAEGSAGTDMTNLIENPMFSDPQGKGWTYNKIAVGNSYITGGYPDFPCAEAWRNNNLKFDVYQDIKNMPVGLYSISCNAFVRMGGNQSTNIDDNGGAYLYMNDFQNDIPTIFQGAGNGITEEEWNSGKKDEVICGKPLSTDDQKWTLHNELGKYFPDGMKSASQAFSLGMYKTTAYGLVEGGQARIGFTKTKDNNAADQWVLWTNFRLVFEGKETKATRPVITKFLEDCQNLKESQSYLGEDYSWPAGWDKDIDETNDEGIAYKATADLFAYPGSDDEAKEVLYQDLIDLNAAIKTAKERMALLDDFLAKNEALADLIDSYADFETDEYFEVADFHDEAEGNYYENAEPEWLDEYFENYDKMVAQVKSCWNTDFGTADDPYDLSHIALQNPDFDEDNGWEGADGTYSVDNSVFEHYNKTFNTYQKVVLAPGKYQFVVWAFDRRGNWDTEDDLEKGTNPDLEGKNKDYAFMYVGQPTPAVEEGEDPVVADTTFAPITRGRWFITEENLAYDMAENDYRHFVTPEPEEGQQPKDPYLFEGYYAPNSVKGVRAWFDYADEDGLPVYGMSYINFEVEERGEYVLGFQKKVNELGGSWFLVDKVELWYSGVEEKEAPLTLVESLDQTEGLADGKYIIGNDIIIVKAGKKYNLNGIQK